MSIEINQTLNNPSDPFIPTTTTPLLSFEVQEDDEDYKCGLSDDDEGCGSNRNATKLWIAIVIACLFFIIELVGGWIAGSLALLSDSFHLLSDVVSFAISLLSIYLARRPATKSLSYGYHRAEILGALISIIIIWVLTAVLCIEAYDRIKHPKPVDGKAMSFVAGIGVVVNIVLMLILGHEHHHGHGDSHSHDHSHSGHNHNRNDSVNVHAALLHVLGDLLSSLGVLISSIVIIFDEKKVWVDPLCTFIFSALVMATTFGVWSSGIRILMEATPSHIDSNAVRIDLESIDGVKSVHDLHIWDLTVGKTTLTAHLRLREYKPDIQAEPYSHSLILSNARHLLKHKYGISQVTIQIDT